MHKASNAQPQGRKRIAEPSVMGDRSRVVPAHACSCVKQTSFGSKGQLPNHLIPAEHGHSPSCSSILSHSSKIKCLMCLRFRLLFRARARIRPRVPTTMCGQFFFSTSSSFLIDRPPKNTATCQPAGKAHTTGRGSTLPQSSHYFPFPPFFSCDKVSLCSPDWP